MCIWGIFKIDVHGSSLQINHAKCRWISQNPWPKDRDTIGGLIKKGDQNIMMYQCEGQLQFDCQRQDLGPVPLLDRSKMCWVASWVVSVRFAGQPWSKTPREPDLLDSVNRSVSFAAPRSMLSSGVCTFDTGSGLIKRPPEARATAGAVSWPCLGPCFVFRKRRSKGGSRSIRFLRSCGSQRR